MISALTTTWRLRSSLLALLDPTICLVSALTRGINFPARVKTRPAIVNTMYRMRLGLASNAGKSVQFSFCLDSGTPKVDILMVYQPSQNNGRLRDLPFPRDGGRVSISRRGYSIYHVRGI